MDGCLFPGNYSIGLSTGNTPFPFHSLPNDLCLYIFKFLNINELCSQSLVCKKFHQIANSDMLWQCLLNDYSSSPNKKPDSVSYKRFVLNAAFEQHLLEKIKGLQISSPEEVSNVSAVIHKIWF